MAKITARGDAEAHRWRRDEDGAELVLTRKGRLLHKFRRGAGFTLLMAKAPSGYAESMAAERGMVKV